MTSELASRLILLIRISSPGDCCIDWTTKAGRKTLRHSIIHTDRHNAILLLPPPLLIPAPSREASVRLEEESRQTSLCVCVCVSYLIVIASLREIEGRVVFGSHILSVSSLACYSNQPMFVFFQTFCRDADP